MANPKKNGSATPILCFFIRGSFSNRKKGLLSQLAPTPPHLKPVKPWVKSTSSWLGKNPSRHSEGTTLDNNDNICMIIIGCWLVVWNIWFIFPYIYNIYIYWESSSQLTHIFQRGWYTTNQYWLGCLQKLENVSKTRYFHAF